MNIKPINLICEPGLGNVRFSRHVSKRLAQSISHQGACDADVAWFIKHYRTTCKDAQALANWLRKYGAWDAEQLADHDANIERAVWLLAGDIVDGNV